MILQIKPADFNPKFEVVGCFCEHDGEILLLHRPAHKPQGNTWNVPAGKVDASESAHEAIIREVWEEAGIEIQLDSLEKLKTYWVRYLEYDYVYHTFRVVLPHREVSVSEKEAQKYGWFTPQKALNLPLIEDEDFCIADTYQVSLA